MLYINDELNSSNHRKKITINERLTGLTLGRYVLEMSTEFKRRYSGITTFIQNNIHKNQRRKRKPLPTPIRKTSFIVSSIYDELFVAYYVIAFSHISDLARVGFFRHPALQHETSLTAPRLSWYCIELFSYSCLYTTVDSCSLQKEASHNKTTLNENLLFALY